jgi:hypothetical protein
MSNLELIEELNAIYRSLEKLQQYLNKEISTYKFSIWKITQELDGNHEFKV